MHLVEPCGEEAVVAALVQHETCVDDARLSRQRRDDLLRARHLWNAGRADEADCFDPRQPGRREAVDQRGTNRGLEHDGIVLQAVTRPDVADR